MKRLLFLLFPVFLCSGCIITEDDTLSAIDYSRMEDAQMHHYRPIHKDHADWGLTGTGKTLTLNAGQERLKFSVRHNPDRILIRQSGTITGQLEKTDSGARFTALKGDSFPFELACLENAGDSHEKRVEIRSNGNVLIYRVDAQGNAVNGEYEVRKLNYNHKYSIAPKSSDNSPAESCANTDPSNTCHGTEVESPFSAVGTLIFHSDQLPLPQRTAAAWFLTRMLKCGS